MDVERFAAYYIKNVVRLTSENSTCFRSFSVVVVRIVRHYLAELAVKRPALSSRHALRDLPHPLPSRVPDVWIARIECADVFRGTLHLRAAFQRHIAQSSVLRSALRRIAALVVDDAVVLAAEVVSQELGVDDRRLGPVQCTSLSSLKRMIGICLLQVCKAFRIADVERMPDVQEVRAHRAVSLCVFRVCREIRFRHDDALAWLLRERVELCAAIDDKRRAFLVHDLGRVLGIFFPVAEEVLLEGRQLGVELRNRLLIAAFTRVHLQALDGSRHELFASRELVASHADRVVNLAVHRELGHRLQQRRHALWVVFQVGSGQLELDDVLLRVLVEGFGEALRLENDAPVIALYEPVGVTGMV